jgi:nicotinate-nucleotide adenylyltransferase
MKKHFAIYGGTFDPLHLGHMSVARSAKKECGIDKLIFMPAYISPFKLDKKVTRGTDRLSMIRLSIKNEDGFAASSYEISKARPSYTIETLRHWSRILDGTLSFVLGFDSAVQVDTWFRGEDILRNYHLITALRPDTDTEEGLKKIRQLRDEYNANITVLDMKPVDISSTEIRERAGKGLSLDGLVSPEVEEYIIEHKLYK